MARTGSDELPAELPSAGHAPAEDIGASRLDLEEARAVRDQIDALPEVLTAAEAAVVLRMSEAALLRLCRSDPAVPARKVAGSWRFSKARCWAGSSKDATREPR